MSINTFASDDDQVPMKVTTFTYDCGSLPAISGVEISHLLHAPDASLNTSTFCYHSASVSKDE